MRDIEAVGLTAGHVIGTCIVAPIKSFPLVLHRSCGNLEGGWVALQDVGQYDCRSEKPEYGIKEADKDRLIINSMSLVVVCRVYNVKIADRFGGGLCRLLQEQPSCKFSTRQTNKCL